MEENDAAVDGRVQDDPSAEARVPLNGQESCESKAQAAQEPLAQQPISGSNGDDVCGPRESEDVGRGEVEVRRPSIEEPVSSVRTDVSSKDSTEEVIAHAPTSIAPAPSPPRCVNEAADDRAGHRMQGKQLLTTVPVISQ